MARQYTPRHQSLIAELRAFMLVVGVAVVARGAVMLVFHEHLSRDPDSYGALAANIVNQQCYCLFANHPTAWRPPLYPILLAPWALGGPPSPLGVAILHLTLAALTVMGVYVLGLQWIDERGALVAGSVAALDPLLVYQSAQVMTETLAAALVVLALLTLSRLQFSLNYRAAMVAGVVAGMTMLCRPTFLFWLPFVAIGVMSIPNTAASASGAAVWKRFRLALVLFAFAGLTVAPWTARNWLVLKHPIIATTHGGYTLWLANNESFYDYLERRDWSQPWSADVLDEAQRAILRDAQFDEVIADRQYQQLALRAMQARPATFLYSCFSRVTRLWSPLAAPRSTPEPWSLRTLRLGSAVWYLLVFAAALLGAARLGGALCRTPWIWGTGLILALTLLHTFYWTDIRMRAPLIPVVALLAAHAFRRSVR